MFVNAKLRECGRVLNVPFGKMAGDHSRYNYSSGRLDDAPYWTDRDDRAAGAGGQGLRPGLLEVVRLRQVRDPAAGHVRRPVVAAQARLALRRPAVSDPVKDAAADEANLTNGSDTLAAIAARDGTTVEALLLQRQARQGPVRQVRAAVPAVAGRGPAPVPAGRPPGQPAAGGPGQCRLTSWPRAPRFRRVTDYFGAWAIEPTAGKPSSTWCSGPTWPGTWPRPSRPPRPARAGRRRQGRRGPGRRRHAHRPAA
jgi:hypothetical protein